MLGTYRRGVATGLALGLAVATGLSVWVTILRVVLGGELDTTYLIVVRTYYAAGLAGGLLVGLAWPLRSWVFGSALLGVLGMLPFYLGFAFAESAPQRPSGESLLEALVLALMVGVPLGAGLWLKQHPIRPPWLEAFLSPRPRTLLVAWTLALLLATGSCVFLPQKMENWPFALVLLVVLVVFACPLGLALFLTLRFGRGSKL